MVIGKSPDARPRGPSVGLQVVVGGDPILEATSRRNGDVQDQGEGEPAVELTEPRTAEGVKPKPFMLWIDSVGGFLVVPGERVSVGQADPESRIDVPIVADLSARHLEFLRGSDGWQVVPGGEVSIGDRRLEGPEALVTGDVLSLAGNVRLKFERPHPLSLSARVSIVSRHRTRPWSDGIVLMGETCLLGPRSRDHVQCRGWSSELVLHRKDGELKVRYGEPIEIDGRPCSGVGAVTTRSRIVGPDFSFSLEPVD